MNLELVPVKDEGIETPLAPSVQLPLDESSPAVASDESLLGLTVAQYNAQIVGAGIALEIARENGVRGITRFEAERLGFKGERAREGLLLPLWWDDADEPVLHQLRPWVAWIDAGDPDHKPIKYVTPQGGGNTLSTVRGGLHHINNPRVPLIFTEGVKKLLAWETLARRQGVRPLRYGTDSARRIAMPAVVNLTGVWGWRGANPDGGTGIPLLALDRIPMAGADAEPKARFPRLVILAFDSDAMEKPGVHDALSQLRAYLMKRGAEVAVMYLPAPDGEKVGLDDFLAAGHSLQDALNCCEPKLRSIEPESMVRQFLPYTVNDLRALRTQEPGIAWKVSGYLALGHVTLVSATPKVGKTTWAFELAAAVIAGNENFVGCAVTPGKVFHLDLEMGETLTLEWAVRYGLDRHDGFRVWSGTRAQIPGDVDGIRRAIRKAGADVLVVDSFSKWTMGHVESEADNQQLVVQVQLLKRLAVELNVAVLIIHHMRKAPGSFSEVIRGGGSIFAEVDIAVNMHMVGKELTDPRRRLEAMGRFMDVTPPVKELTRRDGRYVATDLSPGANGLAGPAAVKFTDRMWDALSVLARLTHAENHPDAHRTGIAMKTWQAGMRQDFGNDSIVVKTATPGIELELVAKDETGRYTLGPKGRSAAMARKWWPAPF